MLIIIYDYNHKILKLVNKQIDAGSKKISNTFLVVDFSFILCTYYVLYQDSYLLIRTDIIQITHRDGFF